ncbi:MAG: type II secretion system protein [Clostridia bacterium]|nr:type II secretion system protein [Clostridia bacterium]
MFKLIQNKKGFTIIELIITFAIVGFVIALAGGVFYMFSGSYQSASERWRIQNAVRVAGAKFETETNLIANSKMLDVFYDSVIAEGILYNKDTNTFTWKNGTPYVVPNEGSEDEDYSYIFSTPAWDASNPEKYLGHYLFIKNFGETTSSLFLDNEGFGETPVEVELSIATDYIEPALTQYEGESDEDFEARLNEAITNVRNTSSYQGNGVKMVMKSGNEEITTYEVETVYTLENFNGSKVVNFENGNLILKEEWIENGVVKAYPCGWSDELINSGNKEQRGYPSLQTKYGANNEFTYNFTNTQIQSTGNVLRFLSPLSDMSMDPGEGQGTTSHKASCIQTWLFEDGTAMGERVLDNFRNFRDNVLRGTEFGDWFISFYYNDLSPFMIENTAFLRPVYKAISKPLSYVCDFIANL